MDCCCIDPEQYIAQELRGTHVCVSVLVEEYEAKQTAQLITECFEKTNTGIRVYESQMRLNALQNTMNILFKQLDKYRNLHSKNSFRTLRGMLSRSSKFAGFTRTYVRQHLEEYPEFAPYVNDLHL